MRSSPAARSSAENFTIEKLKEAAEYCHVRGKKLYLAVNTLILDKEADEFLKYIDAIIPVCPDALILQDSGMAFRIKKLYPELPLHASTQMSLHNSYGIEWACNAGFKRVVIARETPLSDIKNICAQQKAEIEVFMHGALCISFSGQCLMSSMAGQRSGNRGKCAQPCRLPYTLKALDVPIDSGYCLSPKDLCTLPYLSELIDSGVSSLKIEGRLKRPEYVASVVSQYRDALDALSGGKSLDTEQAEKEMAKIFNRGGFTRGYYLFNSAEDCKLPLSPSQDESVIFNKKPNHCGIPCAKIVSTDSKKAVLMFSENVPKGSDIAIGEDIVRTAADYSIGDRESFKNPSGAKKGETVFLLNDSAALARWSLNGPFGAVKLTSDILVRKNERPVMTVSDGLRSITVSGDAPAEPASGKGTPENELREKIMKTGGTPFIFENIKIDTDNSFLRVSEINALRRKALDTIFAERIEAMSNKYEKREADFQESAFPRSSLQTKSRYNMPCNIQDNPASFCTSSVRSVSGTDNAEDLNSVASSSSAAVISDIGLVQSGKHEISAEARTPAMLSALSPYADRLYFSPWEYSCAELEKALNVCPPNKLYLVLPPVMMKRDFDFLDSKLKHYFDLLAGAVVCNPGQAVYARSRFKEVAGDYQLNIINKESLMLYSQICDRITVSAEATLAQARDLCLARPCELLVYGRTALMNLTHCHLKDKGYCGVCRASLADRGGRIFPMERYAVQTCCMRVLNCDKLNMSAHIRDIKKLNADAYRFIFTDETEEQAISAVRAFEAGTVPTGKGYTTGHYYRGLNDE